MLHRYNMLQLQLRLFIMRSQLRLFIMRSQLRLFMAAHHAATPSSAQVPMWGVG